MDYPGNISYEYLRDFIFPRGLWLCRKMTIFDEQF